MRLREDQFERAAELFFEAATVPELWSGALESLADAAGAAGSMLTPIAGGAGTAIASPGLKDFVDDFLSSGWLLHNSNMKRGMALSAAGMKGLITSRDMYTPEEFARDRYVNEFSIPRGVGPISGMVLANWGTDFVLPITFERRGGLADSHSPEEVSVLNRFMARLRPAAILALKIGFEASTRFADSFSAIGTDIALIGEGGRVLHLAPGLERHLGDAFDVRAGVLRSWERRSDRALSTAITDVLTHAPVIERRGHRLALARRSGRKPLAVQFVPITRAGEDVFMLARAIMIVTDPEPDPLDQSAALAARFGLSPAEIRLAQRIGSGEDLKAITEAEGIAMETARARLKSVFAKTGTHRQAELAILVSSLRS